MAAEDGQLVGLGQQLCVDAVQQRLPIRVGEVRPADRAREESVAGEKVVANLQSHATRAVTRGVQHLKRQRTGSKRLPLVQAHHVLEWTRRRAELATQRATFRRDVPLCFVEPYGNRPECLRQRWQAADVVDVGVRKQDGLDVRVPRPRQVDHELGLEVGVDDNRVLRVLILDEVRVGPELAVRRRLDTKPHDASRATVCTSFTPSSFSIKRESCASESISTTVDTTAVLSSYT